MKQINQANKQQSQSQYADTDQALYGKSIRQYVANQSGNKNQINQAICSQSIRQYESN